MTTGSKTFLFSAILICHFLFALIWVHHFIVEMKTNIRKKMPSLYLALFLCCRKQQLENELKVEEYRTKIGPFLNNFEYVMICK
jgi:hypothetical protein